MTEPSMADQSGPLRWWEYVLSFLACIGGIVAVCLVASLMSGCAYKGGKVVDGTNLAIGMTIPGTEWTINALDYVGGVRVAGNDSTHIVVTNEVDEDSSYFGCVSIKRKSKMTADIEPLVEENVTANTDTSEEESEAR